MRTVTEYEPYRLSQPSNTPGRAASRFMNCVRIYGRQRAALLQRTSSNRSLWRLPMSNDFNDDVRVDFDWDYLEPLHLRAGALQRWPP